MLGREILPFNQIMHEQQVTHSESNVTKKRKSVNMNESQKSTNLKVICCNLVDININKLSISLYIKINSCSTVNK